MPASTRTYALLDAWRGVACLAVLCFHAAAVVVSKWLEPQTSSRSIPLLYEFATYGYLGVELFFVISGYCIAAAAAAALRRNSGWLGFCTARIRRIFPTYWFALALTTLAARVSILLLSHGYLHDSNSARFNFSVPYWISNLTLTQLFFRQPSACPVAWTLCYEIGFYAIVAASFFSHRFVRSETQFLSILHGLTVLSMTVNIIAPRYCPLPFDLWPLFGLGILAYDIISNGWNLRAGSVVAVLILQFVAFSLYHPALEGAMGQPVRLAFPVGLAFATVIVLLHPFDAVLSRNIAIRGLMTIGLLSYSLYLTHFIVLGVVSQVFRLLWPSPRMHYVQFVVSIVVAVAAAAVFFVFAERPFMRPTSRKLAELRHVPPAEGEQARSPEPATTLVPSPSSAA
jgi:exopolysaccharide production protein ExoZ